MSGNVMGVICVFGMVATSVWLVVSIIKQV